MSYPLAVSYPDDFWTQWYVIRITYHTLICHPNHLAEIGISSGWVTTMLFRMACASILKSSGWDSKFRFSTPRGGPSALPYTHSIIGCCAFHLSARPLIRRIDLPLQLIVLYVKLFGWKVPKQGGRVVGRSNCVRLYGTCIWRQPTYHNAIYKSIHFLTQQDYWIQQLRKR